MRLSIEPGPLGTLGALLLAGVASSQEPQPLMGQPVRGLSAQELALFEEGRMAFIAPLPQSEGAGPLFNELTCAGCHNVPAIGGFGGRRVTRFGVAATSTSPFQALEGLGGTLLQDQSFTIACRETVPTQATHTALRGTPILFGAGLIESIPDATLVVRANNQPSGLVGPCAHDRADRDPGRCSSHRALRLEGRHRDRRFLLARRGAE